MDRPLRCQRRDAPLSSEVERVRAALGEDRDVVPCIRAAASARGRCDMIIFVRMRLRRAASNDLRVTPWLRNRLSIASIMEGFSLR